MTKKTIKKALDKKALTEENALLERLIATLPEKNIDCLQDLFKSLQKNIV